MALIFAVASDGQTISHGMDARAAPAALRQRLDDADAARPMPECHVSDESTAMVGAVGQPPHVDHREAERPVLEAVDHALLDRRNCKLRGHHAVR